MMDRKDPWDDALGAVNARDLEEMTNRLGEVFDAEMKRQASLPVPYLPTPTEQQVILAQHYAMVAAGEVATLEIQMSLTRIAELLDAWTHYLSDDCESAFEVIEDWVEGIMKVMLDFAGATVDEVSNFAEDEDDDEDDGWGEEGVDWWWDQ